MISIEFITITVISLLTTTWETPLVIVANVLNCENAVCEFELPSCYYVYFRTNTLGKGKNILISLSMA